MATGLQTLNQQQKTALWTERIQACRSSGQTVQIWGREHGVSQASYYKWQRRIFTMAAFEAPQFVEVSSRPGTSPSAVIPGSFAAPETIAHIMVQKFVMYAPLYRQEQEMQRAGLKLSRQTMSNWILNASDTWLRPSYDELHKKLFQNTVLHADETALQALAPDARKGSQTAIGKCYCTKLFQLEQELAECTPEERYTNRLEHFGRSVVMGK